jgi:hypothetical protein
MKTENREIYRCEFCRKIYLVKRYCLYHEKLCLKNEDNKRPDCIYCCFLEKPKFEVNDLDCASFFTYHCKKKDKYMYSKKQILKGHLKKYPESFEDTIPMPIKCKCLEYK